ncbi:MAG: hypothetical protein ACE5FF_10130 [Saprospiraceae bacterium]
MRPFTIVAPVMGVTLPEVELVIDACMKFYLGLSKKQRLESRIILLDNGKWSVFLREKLREYRLGKFAQLVVVREKEGQESALRRADLLFLPRLRKRARWVKIALSCGVPVLTYEGREGYALLDHSCGRFVPVQSREKNVDAFSTLLLMLFFDPGAQKALKQSAERRRRTKPVSCEEDFIFTPAA